MAPLLTEFPSIYGNRRFVIALTVILKHNLEPYKYNSRPITMFKALFNIILPCTPGSSVFSLCFRISDQNSETWIMNFRDCVCVEHGYLTTRKNVY